MPGFKKALAGASISIIDHAISQVPDPEMRGYLSAASLAVKVPYYILIELKQAETEEFVKKVITSDKLGLEEITSAEFQQAIGATLNNLIYAKEKERRDLIQRAFIGGYISSDKYAKDNLERLQETALSMSLPAIQHLAFIKSEILPIRELYLKSQPQKSDRAGYTDSEFQELQRRRRPINYDYDSWYSQQKQEITKEFNRNPSDDSRRSFDLIGAVEDKQRSKYLEYWSEYNSRGIFRQGNDPTVGTFNGGGGSVQYLTDFGERLVNYVGAISVVDEFVEND